MEKKPSSSILVFRMALYQYGKPIPAITLARGLHDEISEKQHKRISHFFTLTMGWKLLF